MAFIEVLSIASIAPLMSVVSNLENIQSNAYLFKVYSILNFNEPMILFILSDYVHSLLF